MAGWRLPGQRSDPGSWTYSTAKGWLPPGMEGDEQGTEYEMGDDFDPSQRDVGWHTIISPPGVAAPVHGVNYTPQTNEVHAAGYQAPIQHENMTIMPAEFPNPRAGGYSDVGTGQAAPAGAGAAPPGMDGIPFEEHKDGSPVTDDRGNEIPGYRWFRGVPTRIMSPSESNPQNWQLVGPLDDGSYVQVNPDTGQTRPVPGLKKSPTQGQGTWSTPQLAPDQKTYITTNSMTGEVRDAATGAVIRPGFNSGASGAGAAPGAAGATGAPGGSFKEGPALTNNPLERVARDIALKYGVNPDVFAKQVNQESGFQTDVTSGAGAKGIAQFMPGTAVQAAGLIGVTPEQFWADPKLQLQGAAALMSKYLTKYNGSYQLALIAYNAGEGAADAYSSGAKPNLYEETRHYLDIILGPGHPQPNTAGLVNDPSGGSGASAGAAGASGTGPNASGVFTPGPDWDIVDTPTGKIAVNKKDPTQVVRIPDTSAITKNVVGTRLVGSDPYGNTADLYKAPNMSVESHGRYTLLINHDTGETNVIQADPSIPTTGPGGHGMYIPSDANVDIQHYGKNIKPTKLEHVGATQPVGWDLPEGTKWGQLTPDQLAQFGPQKSPFLPQQIEKPSIANVGQAPIGLPSTGAPGATAPASAGHTAAPANVASGMDAAADQQGGGRSDYGPFDPPNYGPAQTKAPASSDYGPFDPPGYGPVPEGPGLPGDGGFSVTNNEGQNTSGEMVWDPETNEWVVPTTPTSPLVQHRITDDADQMLGMGQRGRHVGWGQAEPMPTDPNTSVSSDWQPPLDPSSVVGDGNKFGQQVSMEGTHMGTDLQAYEGTPVYSPVDGTVVAVDNDPQGLGIQVHIQGVDGTVHTVAHLLQPDVQQGDQVSAGQPVGKVGQSGAGATGPHLDYRVQDQQGQYINPEPSLGPLAQMPPSPDTIGEDGQRLGQGQAGGDVPDGWPPGFRLPSGADPWDRSSWSDADFDAYQAALRSAPMPQGLGFDQPYSEDLETDQSSQTGSMSADTAMPQGQPMGAPMYGDRWSRPDQSSYDPAGQNSGGAWQTGMPQRPQDNSLMQSSLDGSQPYNYGGPQEVENPMSGGQRRPFNGSPDYGGSHTNTGLDLDDGAPYRDEEESNPWENGRPLRLDDVRGPQWNAQMPELDPQLAQLLAGLAAAGAGGMAVGGRLAGGLGNAAAGLAGMLPRNLFEGDMMGQPEVGQGQSVGMGQDAPFVGLGQAATGHKDNGDGTVTEWYDDGSSVTWNIDTGDFVSDEPPGTYSNGGGPGGGGGDGPGGGQEPGGGGAPPGSGPDGGGGGSDQPKNWGEADDNTKKMFRAEYGDAAKLRWEWERNGKQGGREKWLQIQGDYYKSNPKGAVGASNEAWVRGNVPGFQGTKTDPKDPGTGPTDPKPGTTPPPNSSGTIKLTPYEESYLKQQQQKIDIDKQHQQLLEDQEDNRHNEALKSAQSQADINAENARHNQVMEQLNYYKTNTDAQQAELTRQNDLRMKGSFAQQQQADLLKSALNNPWVQNLTGMAPAFGAAGWNPDSPSVLNDLLRGWEPQANVLPSTTNPSPWGQQAGPNFPTPGTGPQDNTPTPPTQPGLPQNPGGGTPPPPSGGGGGTVPPPSGGGGTTPPPPPPTGGGNTEGPGPGGNVPNPPPTSGGGVTPVPPVGDPPPTTPPGGWTTVPPIPTTPTPAPIGWHPPTNQTPNPVFNNPEGSGAPPQTNVPSQQPGASDPSTMFLSSGRPKTNYLARPYNIYKDDPQAEWKRAQNKLIAQYNQQLLAAGKQWAATGNAGTIPTNPTASNQGAAPVAASPFAAPAASNTSVGAQPASSGSVFGQTASPGASPFAAPTTPTPPTAAPVTSIQPVRQPVTPTPTTPVKKATPVRDAKAAKNAAKKIAKVQDAVMV